MARAKAGMGAETPEVVLLTADERRRFVELLDMGRRMMAESSRARLERSEADPAMSEATRKRNARSARRRERELSAGLDGFDPDAHVPEIRLLLARMDGLGAKTAERASGGSFTAYAALRKCSRVFDAACRAMDEGRRRRMMESALDAIDGALEGAEVNGVAARMAEWAAERLDRETFAERRGGGVTVGVSGGQGGGLVINLVQAALPQAMPHLEAHLSPALDAEAE